MKTGKQRKLNRKEAQNSKNQAIRLRSGGYAFGWSNEIYLICSITNKGKHWKRRYKKLRAFQDATRKLGSGEWARKVKQKGIEKVIEERHSYSA